VVNGDAQYGVILPDYCSFILRLDSTRLALQTPGLAQRFPLKSWAILDQTESSVVAHEPGQQVGASWRGEQLRARTVSCCDWISGSFAL